MAEASRRLFLALWPSAALAQQLHGLAGQAQAALGGRRMRRETLHLTLHFLGAVAEARLPALLRACAQIEGEAFSLRLDRLAYWPRKRLAWAGCTTWPEELDALVGEILQRVACYGSQQEAEHAFFPHVTLLRNGAVGQNWQDRMLAAEAVDWPLHEWVLMESRLSSAGASYQRLAGWALK